MQSLTTPSRAGANPTRQVRLFLKPTGTSSDSRGRITITLLDPDRACVGRIFVTPAAPSDRNWMATPPSLVYPGVWRPLLGQAYRRSYDVSGYSVCLDPADASAGSRLKVTRPRRVLLAPPLSLRPQWWRAQLFRVAERVRGGF